MTLKEQHDALLVRSTQPSIYGCLMCHSGDIYWVACGCMTCGSKTEHVGKMIRNSKGRHVPAFSNHGFAHKYGRGVRCAGAEYLTTHKAVSHE